MGPGVRTGAASARPGRQIGVRNASDFREIDCLRGRLSGRTIADAEIRAERLATGADRVLVASGALDEETYLQALGEATGIAFEPLDGMPRAQCPLDDDRLIEAVALGLLPLKNNDGYVYVVAPRHLAARNILALVEETPATAARFRFTTAERLNRFVLRCAGESLAENAAHALKRKWPALSAALPYRFGNLVTLLATGLAALSALILAPGVAAHGVEILLASFFIAWLALRITGAMVRRPSLAPSPEPADNALPVYTIICALYNEASSVNDLLSAIERLDYPREKLDVILAIEADDQDTSAAIDARHHRMPVNVIVAPPVGPRTKPKALNVALPFARGAFTVVFDAEDRPDPDQLRCALRAFRTGGEDLACVQARLCIDNADDSWLARSFTAEYAAQFDVFLPGLTAMRLPLPLGGSSNHFRTGILREAGGWDAYNVTEDADLGMRLERFGYRADMIDSTTYEEAPATLGAWLKQRTRWFKGWMQTWLVHMRQPAKLLHELGMPAFLTFQLLVGGNALAALLHPLFMVGLVWTWTSGSEIWGAFYGATAMIGYASSAALGWLGLKRRNLSSAGWALLATPLYWLMLSLAAWRALYQLFRAPYVWEKTTHGLAKTSHRAARMTRALLDLEREVELAQRGKLPKIGEVIQAMPDRRHCYWPTTRKQSNVRRIAALG